MMEEESTNIQQLPTESGTFVGDSILDTLKADKGCFLAALVGLLYILHKFCHHFATKM